MMAPALEHWDACTYAALLPTLACDANKYSRGSVLIAAGSTMYPGAAILAAQAATRSGAGYVRLAVPQPLVLLAQSHLLTVPIMGCSSDGTTFTARSASDILDEGGKHFDACVLGPGITITPQTSAFVVALVEQVSAPLLLDADALTIVSQMPELLEHRSTQGRLTVLTPHDGELARLAAGIGQSCEDRISAAQVVACAYGALVVAKGPKTVVTNGIGGILIEEGTPALATAGTGDVLAGLIGGLLAQGLDGLQACALGVYLHAHAGCIAASERSELCVIATDVIESLGSAVLELQAGM